MSWDTNLQGPARQIAAADVRRLRVVAGPGTGKSFALKRRVERLLEQGQDPTRIMVITFTRNAAASLVQDLRDIGVAGCEKVHVGTLHSYCFGLLNRRDVLPRLGRTPRTVVLFTKVGSLQFEGGVMLDDLHRFGNKRKLAKQIHAFEAAWARMQSEQPGWPQDADDRDFQTGLLDWLKFHESMLVGELVPETLRFMRDNPMLDDLTAFDHVIVDEYQDLNRAEQEIIDLLSQKSSAAIVGDADQSIYRFRHAHPDGIEEYPTRHPGTHDESLSECRRCPTRVVEIADHLIKTNHPFNSTPRLQAQSSNGKGEIHIVQWSTPNTEVEGLTEYVNHLLIDKGYLPGDILVIAPRRKLAYQMRDSIDAKGINVHSFYQEEALEEKPAQRAFALLALLSNSEDRTALRWWLGYKSSTGLRNAYQTLRQYCEQTAISPWNALASIEQNPQLLPGVSPLLTQFRELRESMLNLSGLTLPDVVDRLLPETDDACAALRKIALAAMNHSDSIDEISQLFSYIKTEITHPDVLEGDFVSIMSPQKSKGLTSKVVIVSSCIEGVFPGKARSESMAEQQEELRENRRLFYVAITRCREILVLSSFTGIEHRLVREIGAEVWGRKGPLAITSASRFIDELGPTAPPSRTGFEWQHSRYS